MSNVKSCELQKYSRIQGPKRLWDYFLNHQNRYKLDITHRQFPKYWHPIPDKSYQIYTENLLDSILNETNFSSSQEKVFQILYIKEGHNNNLLLPLCSEGASDCL